MRVVKSLSFEFFSSAGERIKKSVARVGVPATRGYYVKSTPRPHVELCVRVSGDLWSVSESLCLSGVVLVPSPGFIGRWMDMGSCVGYACNGLLVLHVEHSL